MEIEQQNLLRILEKKSKGLNLDELHEESQIAPPSILAHLIGLIGDKYVIEKKKAFSSKSIYRISEEGKKYLENMAIFDTPTLVEQEVMDFTVPNMMIPQRIDEPVMMQRMDTPVGMEAFPSTTSETAEDPVEMGKRINDIRYLESHLDDYTSWGESYKTAMKITEEERTEEKIQALKKVLREIKEDGLGIELKKTIKNHNKQDDVQEVSEESLVARANERICQMIGVSYSRLNQFNAANEYFKLRIDNLETIEKFSPVQWNQIQIGECYGSLASNYEKNEKYMESKEAYDKALEIFEKHNQKEKQIRMLIGKGIVNYALEEWDEAIELYIKAVDLSGARSEKLTLLTKIGDIPTSNENQQFLETLKTEREKGAPKIPEKAAHSIRRAAKSAYRASLETTGAPKFEKALWDFNIGVADFTVGEYDKAIESYSKALSQFEEIGDIRGQGLCLYHLGVSCQNLRKLKEAEDFLKRATNILLDLKSTVKVEDFRTRLQADIVPVLTSLSSTLLMQGKIHEAINALEQGNSRELIRKLEGIRIGHCPKMENLLEAETKLASDFQDAEFEIEEIINGFKNNEISEEEHNERITELKTDLLELSAKLQKARRIIYEKCADPGLVPPAQDWNIVENYLNLKLDKKSLIIEFLIDHRRELLITYYCLEKESEFKTCTKTLRGTKWKDLLKQTQQAIELYNPDKLASLSPQLYNLLFDNADIQSTIEDAEDIIIIPHSDLYIVPWEILKPEGKKPLGITHAITRNFSLDLVTRLLRKRERISGHVTLIGNPTNDLPGALEEITEVKETFKNQPRYDFIGDEAKKADVKESLKNAEIIHYAGHADFVVTDPTLSMLSLNDKPLTASEIAQQRFNSNPLIYLSACESGVSRGIKGGEVTGLIHSLILAGSQTIISTNWRVADDSARDFALAFYDALLSNKTAGKALQKARQKIYEDYDQDLKHWGAYTIYGNPFFKYS